MKECNQCGKCCIRYANGSLSATSAEIDYWDNFRPDIQRFVSDGNIWMNPDDGKQLALCPWLRKEPGEQKYTCDIYYDRPDDCRYYPVTIDQMVTDQCEMLETQDLANLKKAQKDLDELMIESRPPLEHG